MVCSLINISLISKGWPIYLWDRIRWISLCIIWSRINRPDWTTRLILSENQWNSLNKCSPMCSCPTHCLIRTTSTWIQPLHYFLLTCSMHRCLKMWTMYSLISNSSTTLKSKTCSTCMATRSWSIRFSGTKCWMWAIHI